jgi:hypothetical protein
VEVSIVSADAAGSRLETLGGGVGGHSGDGEDSGWTAGGGDEGGAEEAQKHLLDNDLRGSESHTHTMRVSLLTHRVSKRFHMRRSWIYLGPLRRSRVHRRIIFCVITSVYVRPMPKRTSAFAATAPNQPGGETSGSTTYTAEGADFYGTHP